MKSIVLAAFALACCFSVVSSELTLFGSFNLTSDPNSIVGQAMYYDSTQFFVAYQTSNSSVFLESYTIFNWQILNQAEIYTVGDNISNVVLNATSSIVVSVDFAFFVLEGYEQGSSDVYQYVLPVSLADFSTRPPIKLENCPPLSADLPLASVLANYAYNYLVWTCGNLTSFNFMDLTSDPFFQFNTKDLEVGYIVSFDANNDMLQPTVYFGTMQERNTTTTFYYLNLQNLTLVPMGISVGKDFDCSTFSLLSYTSNNARPHLVVAVSCANQTTGPKTTEVGTIDIINNVYKPEVYFPQSISDQVFLSMDASSSYAWLTTVYANDYSNGTFVWKIDPVINQGDFYGENLVNYVYAGVFTGFKDFAIVDSQFYDSEMLQLLEFV
eukprot:TRINITY_DN986_c0_g1_i2.p1 TRINITY_DN986_c0_g1~~TRINITY_DN986_c0_g1_i2.p1  ORF type:complete len:383 (+),score=79.02 TRINITY_DN986_c0_g1_i2:290-1438(+)